MADQKDRNGEIRNEDDRRKLDQDIGKVNALVAEMIVSVLAKPNRLISCVVGNRQCDGTLLIRSGSSRSHPVLLRVSFKKRVRLRESRIESSLKAPQGQLREVGSDNPLILPFELCMLPYFFCTSHTSLFRESPSHYLHILRCLFTMVG